MIITAEKEISISSFGGAQQAWNRSKGRKSVICK